MHSPKAVYKAVARNDAINNYFANDEDNDVFLSPQNSPVSFSLHSDIDAESSAFVDEDSCGITLMLRNIPNKYTRDMLLEEIRRRGLLKDMDFFYLPIDTRHACNVGYCFINVTSPGAADLFREAFNGVRLKKVRSKKACFVGLGQIQGLQANIDAYRNSKVMQMNEAFRPMLFENGVAKPFPTRIPGKSKYLNGMAQVKRSVSSRPVD